LIILISNDLQEAKDRKPKKDIMFQFKRIAELAKAGGRRRRK